MAFWSLSALRTILTTETDADSALSEELMSQYRENIEAIIMLLLDTGVSGAADSDPPNDTTGVLTDAAPGFTADIHNGRTLLITSGLAIGNLYTIDDTTTTTLVCTGDNLYSDGVRGADTYKILYDLKNNTDGHDHNGVNSKHAVLQAGMVMLPFCMAEEETEITYNTDTNWYTARTFHIYVPPNFTTIYAAYRGKKDIVGANAMYIRCGINGNYSTGSTLTSASYAWYTGDSLSLSGVGSGWQDFEVQIKQTDTSPPRTVYLQGFSFYCE
jgi:hypothetical protein